MLMGLTLFKGSNLIACAITITAFLEEPLGFP